ncbi:MAG: di-heme oxidoredictase family protein [Acidobacteriota bacterium]
MRGTYILLLLCACGDNGAGEDRQGGATTVDDRSQQAFMHPAANLSTDGQQTFQAGSGPFDFHWGPDRGLGPLFNNDACFGCHSSNGRGRSQITFGGVTDQFGPQSQALVRVSLPTGTPADPGGDVAVPGYGLQLHDHATVGLPQVLVTLSWVEHDEQYGDGTTITLREPRLDLAPQMGTLPDATLTSYRIAAPIIGLGLLDAIDEGTLEALEDPMDADGDGISGRGNQVWNPETQATERGRFGWKANVPRLEIQAGGAAVNDMGLTNKVFPATDGSDNDISDLQLDQMTFFVSTVGVPAAAPRSAAAWRGRELFEHFNCSGCHVPTLVTGDSPIPELAHQTIHPYTDLLLHDMGDGLADQRPDFAATGSEWRTPPLWGIGLAQVVDDGTTFLHDGRARTLEEAILWHGGEALTAREAFRMSPAADRAALIAFLQTL